MPDSAFLSALTALVNLVISGEVPPLVSPFFFDASLLALNKADGGIRAIAIGCTLH